MKEPIEQKRQRLARKAKRQWERQRHIRKADQAKSLHGYYSKSSKRKDREE